MMPNLLSEKVGAHNARGVRLCFAALGVLGVLKKTRKKKTTVGRATEERDALSEPDSSPASDS